MAARRGLSVRRFLEALDSSTAARYFERLPLDQRPDLWASLNADALDDFLADPRNAEAAARVREDFGRVDDVAREMEGLVVRTYERHGISLPAGESVETLAMRLFLDHPPAWEYVWAAQLLIGSGRRISTYPIDVADVTVTDARVAAFERAVSEWFELNARGEQCRVVRFEEPGESLFLLQHGTYLRTVSIWDGPTVDFLSFRPAIEDVLVFDESARVLRVQASKASDAPQYLRLFAREILLDEAAADRALESAIFTLDPFQQGTFDYAGDGPIVHVKFMRAQMGLFGAAGTTIVVMADDVIDAFAHDLGGLTLQSGVLDWVRLRFFIRYPGDRQRSVTFTIHPPSRTDLRESRHAAAILDYLQRQGVKLR